MIMSFDMSMRSTGVCVIDFDEELLHFEVIKTSLDTHPNDEDVIIHLVREVERLMSKFWKTKQIVIESLSFNAKSAKKDVIAGAYWAVRTHLYRYQPHMLLGTVPVTSWRNWYTTLAERKEAKKECSDAMKNVVFRKLPDEVQKRFLLYVEEMGWNIKTVYDLADAYALALYRNSLND